ncbi:hypothetical protein ACQ4N7_23270 [Nodosilinea sp. AN01ver1]|uniref:hypothetical protein n=1 Tax=Nodosilinea sp. AN01ver1 TaxID=3423362 RepID=UPI003D3125D2
MNPLIGHQLTLLPEVLPYLVSNPAACAICSQQRSAKGLSGSCPVCQWRETASSPEQLSPGFYALGNSPQILIVTEQSPDYGQRPLSPEQTFSIGDEVKVLAVQPNQSKVWIGRKGTVHKLSRTRVWVKLRGQGGGRAVELPFPIECLEKLPNLRRSQQRRYSPKGHASGWLEERQGNKKRKTPSVSYYYGWFDKDTCRKRYVPVGKVYRVHEMIQQREPTSEILAFLGVKQPSRSHD